MTSFLSKHKKLILNLCLIALISSLGVFVFGVGKTQAVAIESIRIPVIGHVIGAILELSKLILSKFLYLAAMLADEILGITQFTNVSIVTIGWTITRNLANMFFVLILLVIALATILRLETYGMKQILWKLVVAALLINFSLVIAGFIIDFSQVLTNFFIENAVKGEGVSETIMKGLQVHRLYEHDNAIWEKIVKGALGPSFAQIMESMFAIIILSVSVFAFAAFAFFLIVRIIALWLLLIISPIVWLLMVIPQGQGMWNKWWATFLKWTFFAPIYSFFLYIVLTAIQSNVIATEVTKGIEITEGKVFSSIFASNPQIILQYIFIVLMLLGGLVVAQSMSVYGAAGAIKLAKGAGAGMGKGIGRWTGKRAQMATSGIAGKAGTGIGKAGEWMDKSRLARMTGIPLLTKQIGKGSRAFEEKERAQFDESEKKYKNRTTENLKRDYQASNPRDKAAIGKILSGRKDGIKNFDEKEIKKMIELAKRYDKHGDILKSRPDLAPLAEGINPVEDEKGAKEAIKKTIIKIKPKDGENFQIEAIGEQGKSQTRIQELVQEVITEQLGEKGSLNKDFLVKISDTNPTVNVKIMKDIIEPNIDKMDSDIQKYVKGTPGKAATGDSKNA